MTRTPPGQLSLFDIGDEPPRKSAAVEPAACDEALRALGRAIPEGIRLGTSSWSFPGWTGLVYAARSGRNPGEQTLARHGLAAYARHPLFRTVSIDRTFYAPLPAEEFARYAADVSQGFRFVVKAPAAFTDPSMRQAGSGLPHADNPTFLDAAAAAATFVVPAVSGLGEKAGPLVFQFPPLGRRLLADLPRLRARIAAFMAVLARGATARARPLLAVEVRDPELATPEFAAALADAGVVPCLAVHARMPSVVEQAAAFGLDRTDCQLPLIARWNLHAGRGYEEARADYFPFNRLVEKDIPSRTALARLAAAAARGDREVFITVNNKAEGSAPLSVIRLAEAIAAAPGTPASAAGLTSPRA